MERAREGWGYFNWTHFPSHNFSSFKFHVLPIMPHNEELTVFISQGTARNIAPFYDPLRVYSDEHELAVYGCASTSRWRSFQLLDIPQRRWYELNVPLTGSWPPPPLSHEEEKFKEIAMNQILNHRVPFNTITIDENDNATYEIKGSVGKPLRKQPIVSKCFFPTVQCVEVTGKTYLFGAVDACVWNRMECIYKQLEFDEMIEPMKREIRSREALLHHFGGTDNTLLSKHGICPILAVVVACKPPLLLGILLSNAGISLDNLQNNQISVSHLKSLVETVKHLRDADVLHGDICDRNVCVRGSSIQLIDFGEIAPDYENDVVATGRLLVQCRDRMLLRKEQKEIITNASMALIERCDIDSGLKILQQG
jgi:hypothetical protein